MQFRVTDEYIDKNIINRKILRLETSHGTDTNILWRCLVCEYEWKTSPYHIINRKSGCSRCVKNLPLTDEIIDERIKNRKLIRIGAFITTNIKILWKCLICENEWHATPNKILQNRNCPKCSLRICHDNLKLTNEEFIEKSINQHGENKYGYSEVIYINNHTKVKILCNKHNKYFMQDPGVHMQGVGCPLCNESRGEKKVKAILLSLNIEYSRQNKLIDPEKKSKYSILRFDFFIKEYNLYIEFDGAYHYSPQFLKLIKVKCPPFYNEEKYLKNKNRDLIKSRHCIDNNLHMLRIPFWNIVTKTQISKEDIKNYILNKITFINNLNSLNNSIC